MEIALPRRERLEELLELARNYRGWSVRRLAEELERDPTNLVPEKGSPKLDLILRLARVLDWPVAEVIRDLCGEETPLRKRTATVADCRQLDRAAFDAIENGRFEEAVTLAQSYFAAAATGEQRAMACLREYGGWDGMGRFTDGLDAMRRALRETDVPQSLRLVLRSNLANAHYTLGEFFEAKGIASDLIEWFRGHEPVDSTAKVARALSYYVRGHCSRCLVEHAADEATDHALRAESDLELGARHFGELAQAYNFDTYRGMEQICRGGLCETATMLGRRPVNEVLDSILAAIEPAVEPDRLPKGTMLESLGWMCIFGCNVALRHLEDTEKLERAMAILTNKADEIAERSGNWALRERVFVLEHARRGRATGAGIDAEEWLMDSEDLRILTGTMARFPRFRQTGWQILRTVRYSKEN